MSSKKEVAKAPAQAVAVQEEGSVPAYLKDKMAQGSGQKVDTNDLILPRIKLLHGTSKEPQNFNDAKVGNYWLNVVDMDLGASFKFVPVSNRKRVLLMRPIDDKTGEAILARSDDGITWDRTGEWDVKLKGRNKADTKWVIDDENVERSGLLKFGSSNPDDEDSNPAATVFHEYLVYLPDFLGNTPVLLSFARTGAKTAKELMTKIELRGGPMQSMMFECGVVSEPGPSGDFYKPTVKSAGFATEEQFNRASAWSKQYTAYRGADEEGAAEEGGPSKSAAPKDRGEV